MNKTKFEKLEYNKLIYKESEEYGEDNIYPLLMRCLNCGHSTHYGFQDGYPITKEILCNSSCFNCSCKGYLVKNFSPPMVNNRNSSGNSSNGNGDDSWTGPALVGFALGIGLG